MTTQECKPKGIPWMLPHLCVSDVDRAIDFYKRTFGFEQIGETVKNDDQVSTHAELTYQGMIFMLGLQGAWNKEVVTPNTNNTLSPISLYLYCEDVDALYTQATKAGASGLLEPEDTFWGDRMCRLKDLDGYVWAFATHLFPNN